MDPNQELCDKLDEDIARVRAEIQALTKRRNLLSASLLSSSKVQSALQASTSHTNTDDQSAIERNPLLLSQLKHNQSNIYRLAFGVTAFPFHDPSPEITTNPLIGIRFDMPSRTGKYNRAPYYIFCKKSTDPNLSAPTTLSIHHHTIPALIPLQDYETKYLPRETITPQATAPDEGYYGSTSPSSAAIQNQTPAKQNLHALVTAVRSDLSSWIQRQEAIDYLSETLGLPISSIHDKVDGRKGTQAGRFGISSLDATGLDASFIRIVWMDGRVGRLRLSDEGYITKAAVFSDAQLRDIERMLSVGKDGGPLSILDLVDRLRAVEKYTQTTWTAQQDDVEMDAENGHEDTEMGEA